MERKGEKEDMNNGTGKLDPIKKEILNLTQERRKEQRSKEKAEYITIEK